MAEIGDKVTAVCSFKDGHLKTFGDGVYLGDKVPDEFPFNEYKVKTPCILLDSGKYVWGMECYWGSAESVAAKFKDHIKTTETVEPSNVQPIKEESEAQNG